MTGEPQEYSVDSEIAEIEQSMADQTSDYWRGPGAEATQERYRRLIEARENGSMVARYPREDRHVELERLMADDRSPYWRGDQADQLQAEYRRLISGEPNLPEKSDSKEIAKALGLDAEAVEHGQNVAAQIDESFGGEAAEINAALVGMNDGLRAAMAREISSANVPPQGNASRAQVTAFEQTSAGRILSERWGHDAPRRLATALARVQPFEDSLSDADHEQWLFFWNHGLSANERAAILDTLTR